MGLALKTIALYAKYLPLTALVVDVELGNSAEEAKAKRLDEEGPRRTNNALSSRAWSWRTAVP